jgi:hypothetical protein
MKKTNSVLWSLSFAFIFAYALRCLEGGVMNLTAYYAAQKGFFGTTMPVYNLATDILDIIVGAILFFLTLILFFRQNSPRFALLFQATMLFLGLALLCNGALIWAYENDQIANLGPIETIFGTIVVLFFAVGLFAFPHQDRRFRVFSLIGVLLYGIGFVTVEAMNLSFAEGQSANSTTGAIYSASVANITTFLVLLVLALLTTLLAVASSSETKSK